MAFWQYFRKMPKFWKFGILMQNENDLKLSHCLNKVPDYFHKSLKKKRMAFWQKLSKVPFFLKFGILIQNANFDDFDQNAILKFELFLWLSKCHPKKSKCQWAVFQNATNYFQNAIQKFQNAIQKISKCHSWIKMPYHEIKMPYHEIKMPRTKIKMPFK